MALPGFKAIAADQKHTPKNIPIPPEIKKEHLHADGKLITPEQHAKIKSILKDKPKGRYSKELFKDVGVTYGIIKGDKGIYVIYNDNKTQVHLGKGTFSTPKPAQLYETSDWYALKTQVMENPTLDAKTQERLKSTAADFRREHNALVALGRCSEVIFERSTKKHLRIKKANILMEYVAGPTLAQIIDARQDGTNVLSDKEYLDILESTFEDYYQNIFRKGWLHCDIKALNAKRGKLIDFGFARRYEDYDGHKSRTGERACGTYGYMAPEIHKWFLYSEQSEVFAWGVLFRMFLFNEEMISNKACEYKSPQFKQCTKTIFSEDSDVQAFVSLMLSHGSEQRSELKQVRNFLQNLKKKYTPTNTAAICAGLNIAPAMPAAAGAGAGAGAAAAAAAQPPQQVTLVAASAVEKAPLGLKV